MKKRMMVNQFFQKIYFQQHQLLFVSIQVIDNQENLLATHQCSSCQFVDEMPESDDDDDNLSSVLHRKTEMSWQACGKYLSSAGLLFLPLLIFSQFLKHSVMVSIDYWLALWTSDAISSETGKNCSFCQVCVVLKLIFSSLFFPSSFILTSHSMTSSS